MTTSKSKRIRIRLSINLSQDDLGLVRLYAELAAIENDTNLTQVEIAENSRRHLLRILYQYSQVVLAPFPPSPGQPIFSASPATSTIAIADGSTYDRAVFGNPKPSSAENITTPQKPVVDQIQAEAELALSHINAEFVSTNTNL